VRDAVPDLPNLPGDEILDRNPRSQDGLKCLSGPPSVQVDGQITTRIRTAGSDSDHRLSHKGVTTPISRLFLLRISEPLTCAGSASDAALGVVPRGELNPQGAKHRRILSLRRSFCKSRRLNHFYNLHFTPPRVPCVFVESCADLSRTL
jgi:hypothetical protein